MEIIEGNKLIAGFMGVKITTADNGDYVTKSKSGQWRNINEYLKYHTSWDWLMPVVEKIESIKDKHHGYFGVHISSNNCTIQATNFKPQKPMANPPHYFADWTLETKLKSAWQAVVRFLAWHQESLQYWLGEIKREQKYYPLFNGTELNETELRKLFYSGKSPIDALNDLSTAS